MLLFVGRLPATVDKKHLRRVFSRQGKVTSLELPVNRLTGTRRGYAFVEMADRSAGWAAIRNLDGQTLGNRAITVTPAPFQKPEKPAKPVLVPVYRWR